MSTDEVSFQQMLRFYECTHWLPPIPNAPMWALGDLRMSARRLLLEQTACSFSYRQNGRSKNLWELTIGSHARSGG